MLECFLKKRIARYMKKQKIAANFKDGQHYGLGLHYVLFIGGLCALAMVVGLVFVLIIEFDFAFVFLISI